MRSLRILPAGSSFGNAFGVLLEDEGEDVPMRLIRAGPRALSELCKLLSEMIEEQPCSYPTDVWSFGVLIFDILVGFAPFEDTSKSRRIPSEARRKDTYRKICSIRVPWNDRTVARCIRGCEGLLRQIFVMPPENRPTMREVLEAEWFYF